MTQAQQEALEHVRAMTAEEIEEVFCFNPVLQERFRAVFLKPMPTIKAAELQRRADMFEGLVAALTLIRRESRKLKPDPDTIYGIANAILTKATIPTGV